MDITLEDRLNRKDVKRRKEIREDKRPDLYAKTTKNQSILCFVECE
ncbi:MAG: hypothetical protein QQN49_06555 [Nitrosopumilus sp.]